VVSGTCPPFIIQAGSYSIYVSEAQGAAVDVFSMLDEDQSTNDNVKDKDNQLLTNASFERIEFDHVSFVYPARPQVYVLDDVSFAVERGNTVALVGHSGSGKKIYDRKNFI
jgi:ABC-type multidrug transport system fused ATPase/permease subunit